MSRFGGGFGIRKRRVDGRRLGSAADIRIWWRDHEPTPQSGSAGVVIECSSCYGDRRLGAANGETSAGSYEAPVRSEFVVF